MKEGRIRGRLWLVVVGGWLVVREEEESVVVGHVKSKYTLGIFVLNLLLPYYIFVPTVHTVLVQ